MKKIMFNDRYGLTQAVLDGRKTMTRRIVPDMYVPLIDDGHREAALTEAQRHGDAYRMGEVVAVAQAYKNVFHPLDWANREIYGEEKGWNNKMFVRADLSPHRVQMTDVRIERLQDISDEDCLKEGVYYDADVDGYKVANLSMPNKGFRGDLFRQKYFFTPREAFAALINKRGVGRPGLWELNPWVFAYEHLLLSRTAEHGCRDGGLGIEN